MRDLGLRQRQVSVILTEGPCDGQIVHVTEEGGIMPASFLACEPAPPRPVNEPPGIEHYHLYRRVGNWQSRMYVYWKAAIDA